MSDDVLCPKIMSFKGSSDVIVIFEDNVRLTLGKIWYERSGLDYSDNLKNRYQRKKRESDASCFCS